MALILYHDEACTNPVEIEDPDEVVQAVETGNDFVDEKKFWIKNDDVLTTYENVTLSGNGDIDGTSTSGEIDVTYAPDNTGSPGSYVQELSLANGDFDIAVPIWRKVFSPNVQDTFNNTSISHQITVEEYTRT